MRLALQENLVPGSSFQEKVNNLMRYGFQGVELRGDGLAERIPEIRAALSASDVSATCICGGFKFGLLFPSKEEREESKAQIKALLQVAAEVGAADGVIVVPIFGPPRLPDISPWKTALELEEALLVEQLSELAEFAGAQGTKVILEPLNRYETHFINRLEQAIAVCERVQSLHMTVLADFFHMNIEEPDIAASLRSAGSWVGYVHLADSNRVVPGLGHTDFASGFSALREIGYSGWMSLECGVPGEDKAAVLSESAKFLKGQLGVVS